MKKMKYQKISLIIILLLTAVLITGCGKRNTKVSLYSGKGMLKCSRDGVLDGGTAKFSYEVSYKDGYVTKLHSIEEITSDDSNIIDTYEDAYKKIFTSYENLKYYDNIITRKDNTVTSDTTINYAKIDIDRLLEIEGSEDNVIEDGKVKVVTWKKFAEKFGTTCSQS